MRKHANLPGRKYSLVLVALLMAAFLFMNIIISIFASMLLFNNEEDGDSFDFDGEINLPKMITKEMIIGAMESEKKYGVPASLTIAQIIVESSGSYGNGLSGLAYECKNLFGIKGKGPAGTKIYSTGEQTAGGASYTINAGFRKYHNFKESIMDHGELLASSYYSRYTRHAKNANEWARAIHKAGYATAVNYSDMLIKTMKQYNLYRFDNGGRGLKWKKGLRGIGGKSSGRFIYPLPKGAGILTSPFGPRWGRMHSGVDLAAPQGTAILASDGGIVVRASSYYGYGNCVDIQHRKGVVTRYGHIRNGGIKVRVGQKVKQGQKVAEVGSTGNSTGPHLHFEVIINENAQNPLKYIKVK